MHQSHKGRNKFGGIVILPEFDRDVERERIKLKRKTNKVSNDDGKIDAAEATNQ